MKAIIKVRGSVGIRPDIKYTLGLLRLHRVNHCVVVGNDGYYK
ncbi:MAG: uL30 family ribosomal protein, partial [Euryarchaeota archaeon]|nr:uL30 family ribosomal protein [Euryarchaeota archaeon]